MTPTLTLTPSVINPDHVDDFDDERPLAHLPSTVKSRALCGEPCGTRRPRPGEEFDRCDMCLAVWNEIHR